MDQSSGLGDAVGDQGLDHQVQAAQPQHARGIEQQDFPLIFGFLQIFGCRLLQLTALKGHNFSPPF